MSTISIGIIVGSTRDNRLSIQPAQWMLARAAQKTDISAELVDLRDYPLPFYDEARSPKDIKDDYKNDIARAWVAKLRHYDAFIIVTPEYNHGYPAVLKNALDYAYAEWNKKPVSFVSYGGVGGARVIEQLRLVCIELQMAPLSTAVHITNPWGLLDDKGVLNLTAFEKQADKVLEQLTWWAQALKKARTTDA